MACLLVNLHQHHPAESFEPDSAVDTLREAFPDIEVKHGDQLTVRARQAEKVLSADSEADQAVLTKLKRDASEQGPARAFVLTLEGQKIQGVVKRQLLQMTYESRLSNGAITKIKSVVRSLLPLDEKLVIEELP